jgi:hypothetical protein
MMTAYAATRCTFLTWRFGRLSRCATL